TRAPASLADPPPQGYGPAPMRPRLPLPSRLAVATKIARRGSRLLVGLGSLWLVACQPDIGDSCSVDSECSRTGERICDTSQPGGYCTIFGCSPTSCPSSESVCVSFGSVLSTVPGCDNPNRTSPYARNACMKTCSDSGDCRDDYVCVDMAQDNPWGATVVQSDPKSTKICIAPMSGGPIPEDRANGGCGGQPNPADWPSFGGAAADDPSAGGQGGSL